MAGFKIGEAFIELTADMRKIDKAVQSQGTSSGTKFAKLFSDTFGKVVTIKTALDKIDKDVQAKGTLAGSTFAKEFSAKFGASLDVKPGLKKLDSAIAAAGDSGGDAFAKEFSDAFGTGLDVKAGLKKADADATTAGASGGTTFAREFSDRFGTGLNVKTGLSKTNSDVTAAGASGGGTFAKEFSDKFGVGLDVKTGLKKTDADVNAAGTAAGTAFGNEFSDKFGTTVDLKKGLSKTDADVNTAASNAADTFGARFSQQFTADIRPGLKGVESDAARVGADAGKDFGKKFESSVDIDVKSQMRAAGREGGEAFGDGLDSAAKDAGEEAGDTLAGGIIAALVAIPLAGAVVAIGATLAKTLWDSVTEGLQVEVQMDKLMAQTGLDERTVAKFGRAAGEAYANNFGATIADNMDTARIAIQMGLLDPKSTAQDAESVISSLQGVSDVIGVDIATIAKTTALVLRNDLAGSAQEAFDIFVRGTQTGINMSDDLLDTLGEYGSTFGEIGVDGPMALGLLNQALEAGIVNTDFAADALREIGIKGREGAEEAALALESLGLDSEKYFAAMREGGPKAAAALDSMLDALRNTEDPAKRSAAATALVGTMYEDLGDKILALDPSKAVSDLGQIEGAAKSAIDTLGDNTAGKIETARRNIEVAAAGIKGALATAFAPQLDGFATFVTENRAAVIGFLLDATNMAFDFARAVANATADGIEGFGSLIGYVGPAMTKMIHGILVGFASVATVMAAIDPTGLMDGARDAALGAVKDFETFRVGADGFAAKVESGSKTAAAALRDKLIKEGLDPAQAKLNEVAIPMKAQAALHDASLKLAKDIDGIGTSGEKTMDKLVLLNGTIDLSTSAGRTYDTQVRAVVASLDAEVTQAAKNGDSQAALTKRYGEGRQALIDQLIQMGLTGAEAKRLADKYDAIPGKKVTDIILNKDVASARATALQQQIDSIKQGTHPTLDANTKAGRDAIAQLQREINSLRDKEVTITTYMKTVVSVSPANRADGGFVQAGAGLDRPSMIAPGGANILWAEPETGWETYISGKPSQRTRNIGLLAETARRFGLSVVPQVSASGIGLRGQLPGATVERQAQRVASPLSTLGSGATYGDIYVTISAKDVKEMSSVQDFFATIQQQARKGSHGQMVRT